MTLNEIKSLKCTCWNERCQPLTIDTTKDNYTGRYCSRLDSLHVPLTYPFEIKKMRIYPNVTEQDMINLTEIAEQQKNQRANNIQIRFLKQTHDKKRAESFKPITKQLGDVNNCTERSQQVLRKPDSGIETSNQLAIEKTQNETFYHLCIVQITQNYIYSIIISSSCSEKTLSIMKYESSS